METILNARLNVILKELRQQLRSLYGSRLLQLVLFGSQARGDDEAGSDIDVMVVLQGPVNVGAEIARVGATKAALSLKYDVVIACVFVSAERYATERSPLLLNVRREGMTV